MSYRKKKIKNKVQGLKKLRPKIPFYKHAIFWIAFVVLLIVALFVYVFVASDIFEVKNIKVLGNEKINAGNLYSIVQNNVNTKFVRSIFLTNVLDIKKEITQKYPEIETVSVEKKFPQTINVTIKERKPVAVFCEGTNDCYLIDIYGYIFKKPADFSLSVPVVKQQSIAKYFVTGESAVDKDAMIAIYKTSEILKNNFKINIKDALVTNPLRLNLTTSENWNIYFDLGSDTNFQINKLDLLLKNEISEQVRKSLQYIDLRFKDRAYYR